MDSRIRRKHPSHGNKVLGGIEEKYSGGNDGPPKGFYIFPRAGRFLIL